MYKKANIITTVIATISVLCVCFFATSRIVYSDGGSAFGGTTVQGGVSGSGSGGGGDLPCTSPDSSFYPSARIYKALYGYDYSVEYSINGGKYQPLYSYTKLIDDLTKHDAKLGEAKIIYKDDDQSDETEFDLNINLDEYENNIETVTYKIKFDLIKYWRDDDDIPTGDFKNESFIKKC